MNVVEIFESMTEREKAIWLASFLDGEGTVTVTKWKGRARHYPTVFWTNTNKEVLEIVKKLCSDLTDCETKITTTRGALVYRLSRAKSIGVLLLKLKPFLIVKRQQAELMIQLLTLKFQAPWKYEETEEMLDIIKQIKRCNSRVESGRGV